MSDCTPKAKHYVVKQELGSGASAIVSAVCSEKENDCHSYALKQLKKDAIEELDRESYFLEKLKQSGISPRLREKWCCVEHCYQVVERFDCDFDEQATQQYAAWPLSTTFNRKFPQLKTKSYGLVIFPNQLNELITILTRLSNIYGIMHGDAKLTNFLYDKKHDRIVAADFGLSGDFLRYQPIFGWTHVALGLPKHVPTNLKYRTYFNLWDLEQYMLHDVVVFLPLSSSSSKFRIFTGFGNTLIPPHVRRYFERLGPTYRAKITHSPAAIIRSQLSSMLRKKP